MLPGAQGLRLQVEAVELVRRDHVRDAIDDRDAVLGQLPDLLGVVRQQLHGQDAELTKGEGRFLVVVQDNGPGIPGGPPGSKDADADRYAQAYADAISVVARHAKGQGPERGHGISVKLSALSPRYEAAQEQRVWQELYPRLRQLAEQAAALGLEITPFSARTLAVRAVRRGGPAD